MLKRYAVSGLIKGIGSSFVNLIGFTEEAVIRQAKSEYCFVEIYNVSEL